MGLVRETEMGVLLVIMPARGHSTWVELGLAV